jgi:hypothetical protein
MRGDRNMGLREFIFYQVNQSKELMKRLIRCWHKNYDQQEILELTEKRRLEAQKKYDLLVNKIDDVRDTCPYKHQCPVRKLKLK